MALPTTGLTGHFDASAADDLYKTFVSGGPHTGVPVDGDAVAVWDQEEAADRIFKQYLTNAIPVWRATTPLLPRPCLDFTGGQRLCLTNNANVLRPLSEIITASTFTILIAFYAESITFSGGTYYEGHPLIGDTNAYWGAFLHVVGGVPKVSAFNYPQYVTLTVTPGAAHVLMLRHESGGLVASLDGASESSTPSGNTGAVNGNVFVGGGTYGGGTYDGRLGELVIYNTALSGTALSDAVSYFTAKWLVYAPAAVATAQPYVWGPL